MNKILIGDALDLARQQPDQSVQCIVTSPPYWGLRDYRVDGQLGLEATPDEYVANMVTLFRELRRVLRDDGVCFLNLGDTYAAKRSRQVVDNKHVDVGDNGPMTVPMGLKPKDLIGIPWRVAFALQADGWWLRSDIIWHKRNPMPESVKDRPTQSHEYIFLLTKSARYYYDYEAIKEPIADSSISRMKYALNSKSSGFHRDSRTGSSFEKTRKGATQEEAGLVNSKGRNKRTVWTLATKPYPKAHFATFPPDLVRPCILAGCPPDGVILDPFIGSGTVAMVCVEEGRQYLGFDLNPEYLPLIEERIASARPKLIPGV